MNAFTEDNTSGFSEKDLAVLNGAFDRIVKNYYNDNATDDEKKWVVDRLNNTWFDGISESQLVESFKHIN